MATNTRREPNVLENPHPFRLMVLSACSALDLFDQKSVSTIREFSLSVPTAQALRLQNEEEKQEREGKDLKDATELMQTLQKSRATLRSLSITFPLFPSQSLSLLFAGFLSTFSSLTDFRQINRQSPSVVHIRRTSKSEEEFASNLKVLWLPTVSTSLLDHLNLFSNLSSLRVDSPHSRKFWRKLLEVPSSTLRHLSINIMGEQEGIDHLKFKFLEVLELKQKLHGFPQWLLVPSSVKLKTTSWHSNMPNISELQVHSLREWDFLVDRCPQLKVLRISIQDQSVGFLEELLVARKGNVQSGFEVDGIQMEPLEKVVIPWYRFSSKERERLGELVGSLADSRLEPEFWEVEI